MEGMLHAVSYDITLTRTRPVAGTLASYDEIKEAWCVKTDAQATP